MVDDHRMVVEGLVRALAGSFDVVGVAHDGRSLLELLRTTDADCLLLDLQLPDLSGLELIPRVRERAPTMKVLVVTMHLDRTLADASLGAGADGFIPKEAPAHELIGAVSEVLGGRRYLSPRVPKTSHRVGLSALATGLERLTPREQEIVLLMGEGKREVAIGRSLHISASTVTYHKHHIMRNLGISSEAELLRFAVMARLGSAGSQPPA